MSHENITMAVEEGRVAPGFERYLKPPRGLVEKNHAVWRWAKTWRREDGNLFVHGPEGVGKSSLCRFLLARSIESSGRVYDLAAARIESEFWKIGREDEISRARFTTLLLIDDIGSVTFTSRGLNILRQILDYRHEQRRCTLVTSNVSPEELHKRFSFVEGEQFATSTLRRLRPLKIVEMTGNSFRLNMEYGEQRKER